MSLFHRFQVAGNTPAPVSMDNVSQQDWNDFWDGINQAKPNECFDLIRCLLLVSFFGIWSMCFVMPVSYYMVSAFISCAILYSFHSYSNARNKLSTLRKICKKAEYTTLRGYTVECYCELSTKANRPVGYYVYMFPTNIDGLVRIDLAKDLMVGVTPPPSLSNSSIPVGMPIGIPPTVSPEKWSSFWSEVDSITTNHATQLCALYYSNLCFSIMTLLWSMGFLHGNSSFPSNDVNVVVKIFLGIVFIMTVGLFLLVNLFLYVLCLVGSLLGWTDANLLKLCNDFAGQNQDLVVEFHKYQDISKTSWLWATDQNAVGRSIWFYAKPQSQAATLV